MISLMFSIVLTKFESHFQVTDGSDFHVSDSSKPVELNQIVE